MARLGYRAMGRMGLTVCPVETGLRQHRRVSRKEDGEGLVPEQIKTYLPVLVGLLVCINFLISRKRFLVRPPLGSIVPSKEASSQDQPRYLCVGVP